MHLDAHARRLVAAALREDLGESGDLSTRHFLPADARYRARIVAKREGVLCGRALAAEVFRRAAPGARVRWLKSDGQALRPGQDIAHIAGPRAILSAERTALNFLQHLSGIATLTRAFVRAARGGGTHPADGRGTGAPKGSRKRRARVFDTRKTLPGWRSLAKYAVRCGGGTNHRMGLYDMVLLKDNHLAAWDSLDKALARMREFRRRHPRVLVEVEAKTHAEVRAALRLKADVVMLDNMPPSRLRREILFLRGAAPRVEIEISGGVDLASLPRLARLGADRISVGRITHSAPALDMSLELE